MSQEYVFNVSAENNFAVKGHASTGKTMFLHIHPNERWAIQGPLKRVDALGRGGPDDPADQTRFVAPGKKPWAVLWRVAGTQYTPPSPWEVIPEDALNVGVGHNAGNSPQREYICNDDYFNDNSGAISVKEVWD